MSITRKTPTQILTEASALLNFNADPVNVEQLRDLLISAFANFKGAVFYNEIDSFVTGDNSIKSIATAGLSVGDIICVRINDNIHHFTLTSGELAEDLSPFAIKPTDGSKDNEKHWVNSKAKFYQITSDDLNVDHQWEKQHDLGVKYFNVLVISNEAFLMFPAGGGTPDAAKSYQLKYVDNDNITIAFASAITGTYYIIFLI